MKTVAVIISNNTFKTHNSFNPARVNPSRRNIIDYWINVWRDELHIKFGNGRDTPSGFRWKEERSAFANAKLPNADIDKRVRRLIRHYTCTHNSRSYLLSYIAAKKWISITMIYREYLLHHERDLLPKNENFHLLICF